jgi:hypothetical protein
MTHHCFIVSALVLITQDTMVPTPSSAIASLAPSLSLSEQETSNIPCKYRKRRLASAVAISHYHYSFQRWRPRKAPSSLPTAPGLLPSLALCSCWTLQNHVYHFLASTSPWRRLPPRIFTKLRKSISRNYHPSSSFEPRPTSKGPGPTL